MRHWRGGRSNGATQAARDSITKHDVTSQHKGKKRRMCRRRPGKAPVFEDVLVEDILKGQDDDSSEGRVSAFKRLRGEETRVSAFDRLNHGHDVRQDELYRCSPLIYASRSRRADGGTPRNRQPQIHAREGPSVPTDGGRSEPSKPRETKMNFDVQVLTESFLDLKIPSRRWPRAA
ncbi:unnamed protein product [Cuscuta campestris]|uniref:Uncharacterized protein n=1 Tax=Cuscuta campestris TaxID=132261 RepID=A0A484L424_9ASTE|nr:unnamed protein product [Cuscuta campestris]